MHTYPYPKYNWLPEDLKRTGHNYYNGAGEILAAMDEAHWPPEDRGDNGILPWNKKRSFFIWDPEELHECSKDIKALHTAIIMRWLGPREGSPVKIDLYNWLWKELIEEYLKVLTNQPPELTFPMEFSEPENWRSYNKTGTLFNPVALENKKSKLRKEYPDINEEYIDFVARMVLDPIEDSFQATHGACQELEYIGGTGASYPQSQHPFCRYGYAAKSSAATRERRYGVFGVENSGLSQDVEDKFNRSNALQLRLKLWWGWPTAPFICIERLIADHLAYLIRENYLRKINDGYELTESGKARLKSKHWDKLEKIDVKGALAKGAFSALAPQLIAWGQHFLL